MSFTIQLPPFGRICADPSAWGRLHRIALTFVLAFTLLQTGWAQSPATQDPGYTVKGTVLNADGSPASNAVVVVSSSLGKFYKLPVGADGHYALQAKEDEEFFIHPEQNMGTYMKPALVLKVTQALAQEHGEKGFLLQFLPEEGGSEEEYIAGNYVMVGIADETGSDEVVTIELSEEATEEPIETGPLKLKLFPNLDVGYMELMTNVTKGTDITVQMLDPAGEEMFIDDWRAIPDHALMLPLKRLAPGVYHIVVRQSNGGRTASIDLTVD
jgi:hypothetical protein